MKKLFDHSFLLLILSLLIVTCSNQNAGTQNEWSEFSYSTKVNSEGNLDPNGTKISTKTKVLVEDSYYRNYGDRTQFTVEWKAINTGKTPAGFGWRNKVLIDKEERIFQPYEGHDSRLIQPLDETSILTIRYNLPNAVSVDELHWGLYHRNQEEKIKYRVKLTPENTNN